MAKLTSTDVYGTLYAQGAVLTDSTLSGTVLISTIANGTAPLTVASSTLVTNLNADLLDSQQGSYYTTAGNLTGTLSSTVLGNSTLYIGTTAVALNRSSATLALTGVTNTNWDAAYTHSTNTTTAVHGATTLGYNIFKIANPSAITFPRFNADNTITALSAADFRTAIGAGTSSTVGTVTSVGLSLPSEFTITNSPVTSSGTLTGTWASKTAKTFFAAPNASAGTPSFRAIVASDIPLLNQSTTGQAGSVANSLIIKSDSGTVEGTSQYTFNGSASKTLNLLSGTNVTITEGIGTLTFSSPTPGDGTLSWAASTAGATNTSIAASLSGTYSANTSTNRTMSLAIGPSLSALATIMTGATSGFIKKTAQDTYSLDTNTYITSATDQNTTYSISAVDSGTDALIRLTAGGSGSGTDDDVTLRPGTGISITPSGDIITITNTAPDVNHNTITNLSVGTVTSVNVPILSSDGSDISTLPAATGLLAGIVTAEAQTFGGKKTFNGDVDIVGTLNVTTPGSITYLNSTTVQIDDKNIELGTVATPSDATADGGGITLKGTTDKVIQWLNADDSWHYDQGIILDGAATVLKFGTGNQRAALNMNNNTIIGTDSFTLSDAGPDGFISFNGNIKLFDSPNDLATNTAGNFQVVTGSTRLMTVNTSGQLELPVAIGTAPMLITSTTRVANLNVATAGTADKVANSLTIDTGGLALSSGTTYDGSAALTISHKDTSSQASSNNSGYTYIQDITLDTYGHITGLGTSTWTHPDTSTQASLTALTGANVISDIDLDGAGHVTLMSTRALTPGDIGAQPAGTYDNYVSWTLQALNSAGASLGSSTITSTDSAVFKASDAIDLSWADGQITISHKDTSSQASLTALTGANVVSDIDLDTYGHVTNLTTRALTLGDLGYSAPTIGNGALTLEAGTYLTRSDANGTFSANQTGNETWTINHDNSGVTAGTYGELSTRTLSYGGTFVVPKLVIDAQGHTTSAVGYTLTLPSDNNTLNTAGSTNSDSKLYLVGTTSQSSSAQTYSDSEVFTTNGTLTTNEVQVGNGAATIKYDSVSKSIKFTFA